MYLNSLTYFRAISILFIVMGHVQYICEWDWHLDSLFEKILFALIFGSTAQFVFISGFLFHHKFYINFNFKRFIVSKIKNVFLPFFLLSLPFAIFNLITDNENSFLIRSFIFIKSYITGSISIAFWYIPFVMILFFLSPLFVSFIKLKSKTQWLIFASMTAVSMTIHRPHFHQIVSVFHHVLYYIPVYLFGILCSKHKEKLYAFSKGKEIIYLLLSLVCVALQIYTTGRVGNYHKYITEFRGIDWVYPQKIMLCLFFMALLNRFEQTDLKLLKKIANASFTIYFLHSLLNNLFEYFPLAKYIKNTLHIENSGLLWILLSASFVIFSYYTGLLIKRYFPTKSRMLIGW